MTAEAGANGEVTADDVLATAFDEWGSTCLNNAYPPQAPQFDEVDEADYSLDPNGLEFVVLSEGDGAQPGLNWEVDVQYTGWLDDGCIFDSSYTRSEPTVFPVNAVIPGWQMAITQMKVGERRRVVIPPDLAYGEAGSPPVIPPSATLIFDIILIGGTDPDAASAVATQTADDLLLQATAEAEGFDAETVEYEPITVDYAQDAEGFLATLPKGEVTCMEAYAGGRDNLIGIFSSQTRPPTSLVEQFDTCLSDPTLRNILAGRIIIINPELTPETVDCIGETFTTPTLKPLFGAFDSTEVSEQWITAHFCLNAEERVAFEDALFQAQPNREPIGSGMTFIDVQECMVEELGAAQYFEPVEQPDTLDRAQMERFFNNFTGFLIADIRCRQGSEGYELADGSVMTEESARCLADAMGAVRFGEVFLDRIWAPTTEDHVNVAIEFNKCGIETDFLALPERVGNLTGDDLTCVVDGLENADEPRQSSIRAFSEIGAPKQIIAGDVVAFLFSAQSCGIETLGIPEGAEIEDASARCITEMIPAGIFEQGTQVVLPSLDHALGESASCFDQTP